MIFAFLKSDEERHKEFCQRLSYLDMVIKSLNMTLKAMTTIKYEQSRTDDSSHALNKPNQPGLSSAEQQRGVTASSELK